MLGLGDYCSALFFSFGLLKLIGLSLYFFQIISLIMANWASYRGKQISLQSILTPHPGETPIRIPANILPSGSDLIINILLVWVLYTESP